MFSTDDNLLPPLKFCGGKRDMVPRVSSYYVLHRERTLAEPCVGGMAMTLGLRPERAQLNDTNPHVINLYRHLQRGLTITLDMRYDKDLYYSHREAFNDLIKAGCQHEVEMAELFYYLNRTCFNGLCRFNKSGLFNVPFGKYKTVTYRTDFLEYAPVLQPWQFSCGDAETMDIDPDAFVFLDPPYDTDFTEYSAGGFSWKDQVRIAKRFAAHPGPVIATNQLTPRIVELYVGLGYAVGMLEVSRSISATGDRQPAREMFATKNIRPVRRLFVDMKGGQTVRSPAHQSECESLPENECQSESYPESNPNDGDDSMANLPAALAQKVGEARVAGGGNFIQHGDYVFAIKKWYYQKIQDECIILELIAIESRKKTVYEGQKKVEQEPNEPGSECSSTVNFDGNAKLSAPANSRAPVLGLFGFKENEVPNQKVTETLLYVTSDAQPAAGMLIQCSTFPKEIKSNRGAYITGLDWDCVVRPGEGVNSPEQVRARLALLGDPQALVRLAAEQLQQGRASGGASALASTAQGAEAPAVPTVPVAPSTPATAAPPPPAPAAPPPPAVPKPWLQQGWTAYDNYPPDPVKGAWYYKGQDVKAEADLAAMRW